MSTGAMTGADAPALRALAAQMAQSATRLDGIRQGIRSRLYSVQWDGPDGADFRRMWDGQHVPLLAAVAQGLRAASQELLAEAQQQELASGVGGQTIGPATGPVTIPDEEEEEGERDPVSDLGLAVKGLSIAVGGFGTFFERMLGSFSNQVSGHFRNGSWVDGYTRWNAGRADSLNRFLGSAGDVARRAEGLDRLGNRLAFVGAGFDGYGQWKEDAEYATGERFTRAAAGGVASGLIGLAAERGGIWAGAALGTALIPIPGVGTVVGGLVGWAVATGVTTLLEDQITDLGAAAGSLAYDIGESVVDWGGDALEAGGELLGDIGEGAADLWEDLTPW